MADFNISKYITPTDVAAAVTAGVVAYMMNRSQAQDDQQPQPNSKPTVKQGNSTIRIDHGKIDITDPRNWQDGGIVNVNGNQIHVFRAPDGSVIRVNPYQLQAAGGDPMKAAMNQFATKVQNGQVDIDKLFAAGSHTTGGGSTTKTLSAAAKARRAAFGMPDATSAGGSTVPGVPAKFDMSDQANRFWLEHPDIARAHGIDVSGVTRTVAPNGSGIAGTITRDPAAASRAMATKAALDAHNALRHAATQALQASRAAADAGNFDLAQKLLSISDSNDVKAINAVLNSASRAGIRI